MRLSKYRSASNLYQVFITIERTPLTNKIIYTHIDVPKLNLSLFYSYRENEYQFARYGFTSKDTIINRIHTYNNQKRECPILEINHFKIEKNTIELIDSEDILIKNLGIQILVNDIQNVKLKLNDNA